MVQPWARKQRTSDTGLERRVTPVRRWQQAGYQAPTLHRPPLLWLSRPSADSSLALPPTGRNEPQTVCQAGTQAHGHPATGLWGAHSSPRPSPASKQASLRSGPHWARVGLCVQHTATDTTWNER